MKNKVIITLIMLITTISIQAYQTTVTTHYANKYLSFGSGSVLHDEPVIQSGITTTFDNGLFLGLWGSYSPDGESNFGDEIDFTAGWLGTIGEDWAFSYTFSYFDEPELLDFGPGDILYNKVVVSREFSIYIFALTVRNYTPMSGSGFEGGWLIGTSCSKNFQLSEKINIFTSVELNYDDGGFGFDSGLILNPFASLSYKINDSIKWDMVQASGYIPLTVSDTRENDVMWSTGFTVVF